MRRLGVAGDQRLEVTPAAGGGAAPYVATYTQLFGEVVDISAIPPGSAPLGLGKGAIVSSQRNTCCTCKCAARANPLSKFPL